MGEARNPRYGSTALGRNRRVRDAMRRAAPVLVVILAACAGSPDRVSHGQAPEAKAAPTVSATPANVAPPISERPANIRSTGDPRIDCFRAAYAATDVDAAVAQCARDRMAIEWMEGRSDADANGVRRRIWPELVQASVRARFGVFLQCYEAGLARDARLRGTITIMFVIDEAGHVAKSEAAEATVSDPSVVACVVQEARNLRFPKPDGEVARILYPIIFEPGE